MTDMKFGFTATVFETCRDTKKVKPNMTVKVQDKPETDSTTTGSS